MKTRHCAASLIALLVVSLLAGCYAMAAENKPEMTEAAVEQRMEVREEPVKDLPAVPATEPAVTEPAAAETAAPVVPETVSPETIPPAQPASGKLTMEQAKTIALDHAGFAPEEVRFLRAEYDLDDRVPQFDIEFDVGRWEYEYEIHAETGAVLSFDKDD